MEFRNREALQLENEAIRVTVLKGGGHIAEILHKKTGVNPLWVPPWPSIEPSDYDPTLHPQYGLNRGSRLLSGIMGHNLCLDLFGPPSTEEWDLGIGLHGEAPISRYEAEIRGMEMHLHATLALSKLRVSRILTLGDDGISVRLRESLENLSSTARAIGWTQHVTLGPPFLEAGSTQLGVYSERSRVFEAVEFEAGGLVLGADFEWPHAPSHTHGTSDMRCFAHGSRSSSFTTHLMRRDQDRAFFFAYSPSFHVLFGYEWDAKDFPWLGIWEENKSRLSMPWRGETVACGMEFGVSPFPESREQMVERESLFGVPTFRWLKARERVSVEYSAFIRHADGIPGAVAPRFER